MVSGWRSPFLLVRDEFDEAPFGRAFQRHAIGGNLNCKIVFFPVELRRDDRVSSPEPLELRFEDGGPGAGYGHLGSAKSADAQPDRFSFDERLDDDFISEVREFVHGSQRHARDGRPLPLLAPLLDQEPVLGGKRRFDSFSLFHGPLRRAASSSASRPRERRLSFPDFMSFTEAAFSPSSCAPTTRTNAERWRSASRICALRLLSRRSVSAASPARRSSITFDIAPRRPSSWAAAMNRRGAGETPPSSFCFSMAMRRRSIPAANPTAGVSLPPSSFTRRSYRPPPARASWEPRSGLVISNAV